MARSVQRLGTALLYLWGCLVAATIVGCGIITQDDSANSKSAPPALDSPSPTTLAPKVFRCLGSDTPDQSELRCSEYWRAVLHEYPDLPDAIEAILWQRAHAVPAPIDGSNVSITLSGEKGEHIVQGESLHLIITDLDTPSLQRLRDTLLMAGHRHDEIVTKLAERRQQAEGEMTPAARVGARVREAAKLEQLDGKLFEYPRPDISGWSARDRFLGGGAAPLRAKPPAPPPRVVVLGSGAHVTINGVSGSESQKIDINVFDGGVHGTGTVEIYAFRERGHAEAEKLRTYLTKSGKAARPPPTVDLLVIGSLATLEVGDARDFARQEVKLSAWLDSQHSESRSFEVESLKEAEALKASMDDAERIISEAVEAREFKQIRERLEERERLGEHDWEPRTREREVRVP